jgi:hypothetical protein
MVTGIECVGVILGVLPLVIELSKAYSEGYHDLAGVVIPSRHHSKVRKFYQKFFWEIGALGHCLDDIIKHLPNLSLDQKAALGDIVSLEKWTEDAEVDTALRSYLRTDANYARWNVLMTELVSVIWQFTADTTVHIAATDTVSELEHSNSCYRTHLITTDNL